jgi:hypothetical protein
VVVPKEDTVFAAGDEVLVVTSEASEVQVRELLVGEPASPDDGDEGDDGDRHEPEGDGLPEPGEPAEQRLQ